MSSGPVFGSVAWPVKRAPNCSPVTQMTTAATAATASAGLVSPATRTPAATVAKAVVNAITVSGA